MKYIKTIILSLMFLTISCVCKTPKQEQKIQNNEQVNIKPSNIKKVDNNLQQEQDYLYIQQQNNLFNNGYGNPAYNYPSYGYK